jgi:WD40 repeat protein
LASGCKNGDIKIWDYADLKKTITGHTSYVSSLVLLKNGNLASSSLDNTIKIWNTNDFSLINSFGSNKRSFIPRGLSRADQVKLIPLVELQNAYLACASTDNTIKIFDVSDGSLKQTLKGHTDWIQSLAVLSNGILVSGSIDSTIKIWKPDTGEEVRTLTEHVKTVGSLFGLPDLFLASGSEDATLKFWNLYIIFN